MMNWQFSENHRPTPGACGVTAHEASPGGLHPRIAVFTPGNPTKPIQRALPPAAFSEPQTLAGVGCPNPNVLVA